MTVHLKLVENNALRITLRTVPGTVPEVVLTVNRKGNRNVVSGPIASWEARGTAARVGGLNPIGTCRPTRNAVLGPTLAATFSATVAAVPQPILTVVCGVIR